MATKRGGSRFKENGRKPIRKSRQEALRRLALQGIGFTANGNQRKDFVSPSPSTSGLNPGEERAGQHMYYGYKLQGK